MMILAKSIKFLAIAACLILLTAVISFGWVLIDNNRDETPPTQQELEQSLEASLNWLVKNQQAILSFDNAILWHFLDRAQEISPDPRIQILYNKYRKKYLRPKSRPMSLWVNMFEPGTDSRPINFSTIAHYNYYSKHWAYAVSCDSELIKIEEVRAQNHPEFCGNFTALNPTCTTHQLMGIRLMQRAQCGDPDELSKVTQVLQRKITDELFYDPRVLDVYIQRAMMLYESGRPDLVKHSWIRNILDQQHDDGGWGNFQPLLKLNGQYVGFGHGASVTGDPRRGKTFMRLIGWGQPTSTFHATAQGVLLLTHLVNTPASQLSRTP